MQSTRLRPQGDEAEHCPQDHADPEVGEGAQEERRGPRIRGFPRRDPTDPFRERNFNPLDLLGRVELLLADLAAPRREDQIHVGRGVAGHEVHHAEAHRLPRLVAGLGQELPAARVLRAFASIGVPTAVPLADLIRTLHVLADHEDVAILGHRKPHGRVAIAEQVEFLLGAGVVAVHLLREPLSELFGENFHLAQPLPFHDRHGFPFLGFVVRNFSVRN